MSEIVKIKLADIVEEDGKWNRPLEAADGPEMAVLEASLANMGQLTPIVARPVGRGKWQVVMGHRRVRAARKLKWKEIAADVREMSDDEARGSAFAENYARKPVSIYWEAEEVRRWLARGKSIGQVAGRMGRSWEWVKRRQRLDLEACRRFKKEVLDPRGIAMDNVHPVNLEALAEVGEEAWEKFGSEEFADQYPADYLRIALGDREWIARNFVRNPARCTGGRAWAGACQDLDTGEAWPECSECEHVSGKLASLFPELDANSFGWDKTSCARMACQKRKQEAWQKLAAAEAKEKHPGLEVLSSAEATTGTWVKCKAAHPGARIKIGTGDASGKWEVVRAMGEVTGKAEGGEVKAQWPESASVKRWEEERRKQDEARKAMEKMLDMAGAGIDAQQGMEEKTKEALWAFVNFLKKHVNYDEPDDAEFLGWARALCEAVLPKDDLEKAEEAMTAWAAAWAEED